jgi:hypothetical protein
LRIEDSRNSRQLASKAGGCPASFKFELEINPMRFISTRVHGVLDYLTAGVLIAAPSTLGFRRHSMQRWLPLALGVGTIGYSLLTDYELGPFKVIPMPMHLALDAANGALLAASPWLFGFAEEISAPHLGLGLFEILVTASSQSTSSRGADSGTPSSV